MANAVAQKLAVAYNVKDADRCLTTFAPRCPCLRFDLLESRSGLIKNLVSFVRADFDPKSSIHFKFDDHFISPDGHFTALRGHYTNLGKDAQPVTVQMVTLLEVKDGKVIKESDVSGNHCSLSSPRFAIANLGEERAGDR